MVRSSARSLPRRPQPQFDTRHEIQPRRREAKYLFVMLVQGVPQITVRRQPARYLVVQVQTDIGIAGVLIQTGAGSGARVHIEFRPAKVSGEIGADLSPRETSRKSS